MTESAAAAKHTYRAVAQRPRHHGPAMRAQNEKRMCKRDRRSNSSEDADAVSVTYNHRTIRVAHSDAHWAYKLLNLQAAV